MNLAKDAFIVLFCLAGSDGNLDERERALIIDFLNRQSAALGQMNFAPPQAASEIAALDLAGRGEMLNRALENLKAHSSPEVRLAMLDAAAEVATTDGVLMLPYESLTINRAAVFTAPDCAERFLSQFSEKQRAALTEVTVRPFRIIFRSSSTAIFCF